MRTFTITILFALSTVGMGAATLVKPNQDKPSRVILASAKGSGLWRPARFPSCGVAPVKTQWEHHYSSGGSYSQTRLLEDGPPCSVEPGYEVYETWDADLVEYHEYWKTWYEGYPNVYRERIAVATNNTSEWFPWANGSLSESIEGLGEMNLKSKVTLKLRTGGKIGSKLKQLFMFEVWASAWKSLSHEHLPRPWDGHATVPQIPGATTNQWGTCYAVLPDDVVVDITPKASDGYYNFYVAASKFRCSFSIGIRMPYPNGTNAPLNDGLDFGHASWRFRTDATEQALETMMFEESFERGFLDMGLGYYPKGDYFWQVDIPAEGVLDSPDYGADSSDIWKVYEIGFPDLLKGLRYTGKLKLYPGKWRPFTHNCVHAARNAGTAAGVKGIPSGIFPQRVGEALRDE